MDYVLDSLRSAFEDEVYKRSRAHYSLYIMLLATSLDRKFLVDYLSAFHEAHALTGDRCLVVGPRFKPPKGRGFPHWTERQIRFAQLVLIACSPGYREKFDAEAGVVGGLGVKYEAHFIRQELYDKALRNDRFIPITFSDNEDDVVPALLRPYPRFQIPGEYRKLLLRVAEVV